MVSGSFTPPAKPLAARRRCVMPSLSTAGSVRFKHREQLRVKSYNVVVLIYILPESP